MKAKYWLLIRLIVVVFFIIITFFRYDIALGAVRLTVFNKDIVRISDEPIEYMTRKGDGDISLLNLMKSDEWNCMNTFENELVFEKYSKKLYIKKVPTLNYYILYKIKED